MTLTIKYSHPHFPDGTLVGVHPFGELENNGAAVDISEETEQRFIDENGVGIEEAFANDSNITVAGTATVKAPEPAATTTTTTTEKSATAPPKKEGGEK
jgi:hypothetical protein